MFLVMGNKMKKDGIKKSPNEKNLRTREGIREAYIVDAFEYF
jgi:hypothetical protein